jgi:hypothetical protein
MECVAPVSFGAGVFVMSGICVYFVRLPLQAFFKKEPISFMPILKDTVPEASGDYWELLARRVLGGYLRMNVGGKL